MLRDDIDSLTPTQYFNRRSFIASNVCSGFAAAVLPATARTIKTDSIGLTVGEVSIPVGDFNMPAYRVMPFGKSGLPLVLVVSEIFGAHEHIADVTRRFAKLGYLAMAPELFVRQGDAQAYGEIAKLIAEVASKVPYAQVMGDLEAAVAWAGANGGDTARVGITGFCWGGRIVWLYAAHNPEVKAGVAWYGRLAGAPTALQPTHPVELAGKLNGPLLGLYSGADPGTPLDTVDKMKSGLNSGSASARRSEFVVYPDTPHAFHADPRPSIGKQAAEHGRKRCTAWFKTNGVG